MHGMLTVPEEFFRKACFRSYPVSLLTFQMREKAAFLLIFFRKGNIMKRKLGTANR